MFTAFEEKFTLHYAQIVFRLESRINRGEKMNDWAFVWVRIKCRNDEVAVLTGWPQRRCPTMFIPFLSYQTK